MQHGERERCNTLHGLQYPALRGPIESKWQERASQYTERWSPPRMTGTTGGPSQEKVTHMNIFHAVVIGLLLLIPWSLVGVNIVGAAVTTVGRKLAPIRKKS